MRAISSFSFEAGTSIFWCLALCALRMRVTKSATGSVKLMLLSFIPSLTRLPASPWLEAFQLLVGLHFWKTGWSQEPAASVYCFYSKDSAAVLLRPRTSIYQLDLETPGISPLSASPRKHKRHRPNLRKNA